MDVEADDVLAIAEAREAAMRQVFSKYDVDGSGTIDSSELAVLLVDLKFDDRVVEEEFARADHDNSRELSFEEFCVYYNQCVEHIRSKTRGLRSKLKSKGSQSRPATRPGRRKKLSSRNANGDGGGSSGAGAGSGGGGSAGAQASSSGTLESEDIPLPPKPELIRFDSISDEIAAFERGELPDETAQAPVKDDRVACKTCGRKFFPTSIERHERICAKAAENAKRRGKFRVKRTR